MSDNTEPRVNEYNFKLLEESFLNFLTKSSSIKDNNVIARQLKEIVREWLISNNWDLGELVDKERLKTLTQVIDKFADVYEDGFAKVDILKAFEFIKPATSIEFGKKETKRIRDLRDDLDTFFFVSHAYVPPYDDHPNPQNITFVSRIRHLVEILKYFTEKYKGNYEEFAGVVGLLLKYFPVEIAKYCSSERMKYYKIIK